MQVSHVDRPPTILNYSAPLLYAIISSCVVHYVFLVFYDDSENTQNEICNGVDGM
jgi:hypothetical protein